MKKKKSINIPHMKIRILTILNRSYILCLELNIKLYFFTVAQYFLGFEIPKYCNLQYAI